MRAYHRKRLERLAEVLENWEEQKPANVIELDMESWFNQPGEASRGWSCNTAACALGSACFVSEFNKAGLHADDGGLPGYYDVPKLRGFYSDDPFIVGSHFFGITFRQSVWLFDPDSYEKYPTANKIKPKTVAKRVRSILDGSFVTKPLPSDDYIKYWFDDEYIADKVY